MPPVAVYFVKSRSIALIAPRLTCTGVGKSGSPKLRSTTSIPRALRRSASIMIASVGDTEILLTRPATCNVIPIHFPIGDEYCPFLRTCPLPPSDGHTYDPGHGRLARSIPTQFHRCSQNDMPNPQSRCVEGETTQTESSRQAIMNVKRRHLYVALTSGGICGHSQTCYSFER